MSLHPSIIKLMSSGNPVNIEQHCEVTQKIADLFDKDGNLKLEELLNLHQLLFPEIVVSGETNEFRETEETREAGAKATIETSKATTADPKKIETIGRTGTILAHHEHGPHHTAIFPPPSSMIAEDLYNEFQINNIAIQRLSHLTEPEPKGLGLRQNPNDNNDEVEEIVHLLIHRNQRVATAFVERFSPARHHRPLELPTEKPSDPKLITALSDLREKSDKLYRLHHEEMGAFLRFHSPHNARGAHGAHGAHAGLFVSPEGRDPGGHHAPKRDGDKDMGRDSNLGSDPTPPASPDSKPRGR